MPPKKQLLLPEVNLPKPSRLALIWKSLNVIIAITKTLKKGLDTAYADEAKINIESETVFFDIWISVKNILELWTSFHPNL